MKKTNNKKEYFIVSPAPHVKSKNSIQKMMLDTIISLLPAGVGSVVFFGLYSIYIVFTAILVALLAEYLSNLVRKQSLSIVNLSCIVTGLLFAYTLPPRTPLWIVAIGVFVSIIFAKELFGGIGFNPFNPALVGRAFVHVSFPQELGNYSLDALTSATPLTILKHFPEKISDISPIKNLIIGNYTSSLGESSVLLIIIGYIYLTIKKHINPIPSLVYIFTVLIFSFVFSPNNYLVYTFSGGLFLGAVFMATDPVTTPVSLKGKIIFCLGCGILTSVIRFWGSYPEGVCFSILFMNLFVPIIDNYTVVKKFGK